jgi:hypothetical protein
MKMLSSETYNAFRLKKKLCNDIRNQPPQSVRNEYFTRPFRGLGNQLKLYSMYPFKEGGIFTNLSLI